MDGSVRRASLWYGQQHLWEETLLVYYMALDVGETQQILLTGRSRNGTAYRAYYVKAIKTAENTKEGS